MTTTPPPPPPHPSSFSIIIVVVIIIVWGPSDESIAKLFVAQQSGQLAPQNSPRWIGS